MSFEQPCPLESLIRDHIKPIERDILGKDKPNITDITTSFSYHFDVKDCFLENKETIGKALQPTFFHLLKNRLLYEKIKQQDLKTDKWKRFCTAYECFFKYRIALAKIDFDTIFKNKPTYNPFFTYLKPEVVGSEHWDRLEAILLQKINPNYASAFNFMGMNAKVYFAIEYRIMYILRRICEDAEIIEPSYVQFEDSSEFDYNYLFLNLQYKIRYGKANDYKICEDIRVFEARMDETTPKKFIEFCSTGVLDEITLEDQACFKVIFENVAKRVFGRNRKYAKSIPLLYAKHLLLHYHGKEKINSGDDVIFRTNLINALRLGSISEAEYFMNSKSVNDIEILSLVYGK